MDLDPDAVASTINAVALLLVTLLVGSGIFAMVRRGSIYRAAHKDIPVIMKRDVALLGALAFIAVEAGILRMLHPDPLVGWQRTFNVAVQSAIVVIALAYWVKVELFDVDDPDVK